VLESPNSASLSNARYILTLIKDDEFLTARVDGKLLDKAIVKYGKVTTFDKTKFSTYIGFYPTEPHKETSVTSLFRNMIYTFR
jgi:hypothetical protein